MIYSFLGVVIVIFIIGTSIGACCIVICMKCCRRSQRLRLEEANKKLKFTAEMSESGIGHHQTDAIAYGTDRTDGSNINSQQIV